jgi:hypothetical protein
VRLAGNGIAESSCQQCLPGKYLTGLGSPRENYCTGCETGKFQSLRGAVTCTLCDAGTYSSAMNVSSSLQCQSCNANYFSAAGSSACSADCPSGTFPGLGMRCEYCESGKYLSYRGSKSLSECLLCSSGTYSTASGVSSSNTCQFCQPGYFSVQGAEKCVDCGFGKYQTGIGASAISDCVLCENGKYSQASNASALSECIACHAGRFCAAGCSVCLNCSAGTYQTSTGSHICTACMGGTYSNETGASSVGMCKLCHAGSYSFSNSSACTQCLSGTFSTAVGFAGKCSSWKSCQLFIEVEDDLQLPSSAADRVCIAYQYNPPRAAKLFIIFGQVPFCCLFCFVFLRYAPRRYFTKTKSDGDVVVTSSPNISSMLPTTPYFYGDESGGVLFTFNVRKTSIYELIEKISNSRFVAPVHKSLVGAFHDFVIGVHDVVSDCSLLLLVASDAPGFFLKNMRGDLFYIATFAVVGSVFLDLVIAVWCDEPHLMWLYIASCTDIIPSRRGKITYIHKVMKFFVESVPIWIVQSVFIYQTYMKNQAEKAVPTQASGQVNTTTASTTPAPQLEDQNPDWWIDYGIVSLSLLGTLFNVIKNVCSLRRMLQYDWNHVLAIKCEKISCYVALVDNELKTQTMKNDIDSEGRVCGIRSCNQKKPLNVCWKYPEGILKTVLFIKPPSDVVKTSVHMLHQPENIQSNLLPYLNVRSVECNEESLKYPVFADFRIKQENNDQSDAITFIYALEISGENVHSPAEKRNWLHLWKWNCCNQSVPFEIKEYYASKNSHDVEAKWVSNKRHNPMIQKS